MPANRLEQFGGMLPAWDDRLLPADQSALARNTYLYAGTLKGWRKPKLLRALTNGAAKFAFRVPTTISAVAGAYLTLLGNPQAGDTVTLGEEVYTFTAAVTTLSPAYNVLIGANATASATNLFQAFLGTGAVNVTYGAGTVSNPAVDTTNSVQTTNAGNPVIHTLAPTFGAAYNSTVVGESTAHVRLVWTFDLVSIADTTTAFTGGANQTSDNSISGASTWLEFVDPDTNVMRSPVVDDQFGRFYFASPSLPPQYNTTPRIQTALPPFLLGVPAPGCAPTVTATGGGNEGQLGFPTSSTGATTAVAQGVALIQVTPVAALSIQDVSFMPSASDPTGTYQAVLYSDLNGAPSDLLNVGAQVTGSVAGTAMTSQFSTASGLLAGVPFWIGIMCGATTNFAQHDATTNLGKTFANAYANGAPIAAPAVTPGPTFQIWGDTITEDVLESRSYVYTWQTAYGEEGPPSPPTNVDSWTDATWTIGLWTPPPTDMGVTRNITLTNIYRAITASTTGVTTYFFVTQVPVAQATFVDTIPDSTVALNLQLQSSLWYPPPTNLQGILAMPNGMSVGFVGNEIWFSEAYRPHAWPPSYVLTTEFPIIGIGVTGQSVVACTASKPAIATGIQPSAMALNKVDMPEPCLSRGSIISTSAGVYYASLNGLILIDMSGGGSNTTQSWITKERWRALTPAKNIRAVPMSSAYFALGTTNGADVSVAQDGFSIDLSQDDAKSFTIWPQAGGHRIGFNKLTAPNGFNVDNIMIDPWSGYTLLVQNNGVYYYDFADPSPAIIPYLWRSKKFQEKSRHSFSVMRIWFDIPPGLPAQNAVRDVADPQPAFPDVGGQYGIVRVYADDILHTTREIRKSGELLRLKSGVKAQLWQVEVESILDIKNVEFASSVRELTTV